MATLFPEHVHVDKLAVLASASVQQSWHSSEASSNYCLASDDSTTTAPSTGPVTPNSTSAHSPSDHDFPDSPMEMSCDAAAQIIARMQGCAGDRDYHPRSSIGCNGQEADYLVQNSAFLQILEAASFFKENRTTSQGDLIRGRSSSVAMPIIMIKIMSMSMSTATGPATSSPLPISAAARHLA
ncbi:hypothetical protein ESCO_005963 [Escovopsis weberi]|uniref:Uncharacterized protein n=1 Tax=Escovopsis weberi TaxID=150374 RepID=A0A0M8MZY5_ESCWE|nr:hypothetical protein ESCO_005963 [Escovopsis weberi]